MKGASRIDRRAFAGVLGTLALGACAPARVRMRAAPSPRPDFLGRARQAATYLRSLAVATEHGLLWRKSPDEPGQMETDLYHGSTGPALFLLELARATGQSGYLNDAERGMAHLVATAKTASGASSPGLYGGITGHALLATEVARTTGAGRHLDVARDIVGRLERDATAIGAGLHYATMTDVLYGGAGVVLWLIQARSALDHEGALRLAVKLGDGLIALSQPTSPGRRWLMRSGDTDDKELPNFSHGTAGVAFALARLYEESRQERFLAAALEGAEHLLALAYTAGDVCLVPHAAIGDGRERYYLGYCHGPAGTARLFYQLHRVTSTARWQDCFRRSVNGVLYSGVPASRTPGYWDNVGQCCGAASLTELMLSLHRVTGEASYLELAEEIAADVLARATPAAGGGLEWIHAENRVEPYWRQSYTGYMQGAAGIGSMLVRLAGHARRAPWKVRLPDNPWPV